jgi:hypothetical protein
MRFYLIHLISIFSSISTISILSSCEQKCPVYFRFQLQCASDGNLYTDLCRAKCKNSKNKILFDCGINPNSKECKAKCSKKVNKSPPKPSKTLCLSKCNNYFAPQAICANDNKLYMDLCRAKCNSKSLTQLFKCPFPLNRKKCAQDCKNYTNNEPVRVCSKHGLVCSYEGRVFSNECDLMRCSNHELRFRCSENGINNYKSCEWFCYQFQYNSYLKNCFDNEKPYACFEDGIIRKDRCIPRYWRIKMKFLCNQGLNHCRRKCQYTKYWY